MNDTTLRDIDGNGHVPTEDEAAEIVRQNPEATALVIDGLRTIIGQLQELQDAAVVMLDRLAELTQEAEAA